MISSRTKTLLLLAPLFAALHACGGSDGDSAPIPAPVPAPAPAPSPAPVAPALASCFDVTPGVAYTVADTENGQDGGHFDELLVNETFEGVERSGQVEFTSGSPVRNNAVYWSQELDGIRFWGDVSYDQNGALESKRVNSAGFTLPLTLQPGQSTVLDYTVTVTQVSGEQAGQVTVVPTQQTVTFEGFESLTLGGRTFSNVCRIKAVSTKPAEDAGDTATTWFAPGFGQIQSNWSSGEVTDTLAESLVTINAQP